jgi:hypothetical protein
VPPRPAQDDGAASAIERARDLVANLVAGNPVRDPYAALIEDAGLHVLQEPEKAARAVAPFGDVGHRHTVICATS